jgi:tetratricopeptide (TPR) repeat protein
MGDAYLKLKEYQEAIGAYKEVIKITSDFRAVFARKLVKIKPSDYKPIEPISDDYYADLNQSIYFFYHFHSKRGR